MSRGLEIHHLAFKPRPCVSWIKSVLNSFRVLIRTNIFTRGNRKLGRARESYVDKRVFFSGEGGEGEKVFDARKNQIYLFFTNFRDYITLIRLTRDSICPEQRTFIFS